ncbi:MAG: chemotaxis protein CheA [Desulfamplus sp.]|nr:chemotaxis protein CheA [Desulfamplus sp.]
MERLKKAIESLSSQVAGLCIDGQQTPDALDSMIITLEDIEALSSELNAQTLQTVAGAYKSYVKSMTNCEIITTSPLEQGLTLLHALLRHLEKGAEFMFDISDVLEILDTSVFLTKNDSCYLSPALEGISDSSEQNISLEDAPSTTSNAAASLSEKTHLPPSSPNSAISDISEDDLRILSDFISEAEENLDTIEIELMDLEQDPTNHEIINNIFRPFHTIKGVSGFLDLKKINKLSHSTENLLDGVRNGDFLINDKATDVILESVDMLKKLLAVVKNSVQNKIKPDDSNIDIEPLRLKLRELPPILSKESKEPVGKILLRKGIIDSDTLDSVLEEQERTGKKIGEILLEEELAGSSDIASALMEQKSQKKYIPNQVSSTQVKVNTSKLDDLVDYAGELVIAQSMLKQQALKEASFYQSINQLEQIVSNIQRIAMSMRMIPIHSTFTKMIRLVRDLSKKSRKDVTLEMSGEDTEIDRNVVDALYEPMVHMIRNAIDHGIETANDRVAAGKPPQGKIYLRAYHKGGSILIEIEDDGKGLDRERILEKGIAAGLIKKESSPTDSQIFDIIMAPGFSTAKTITDISGRGVGMDVVKDGIEKFRGSLDISSEKGKGTCFTISLPLTLAIIDGMLVRIGKEKYVIPTISIQRSFRPDKKDCFTLKGKGEMIKERDELITLIRMKNICNVDNDSLYPWESLVVVVESKEEKRGLLVDELLGKDEYVIKSLGGSLENITGFSGGAILADGKVGLILDMHGIFELSNNL